MPIPITSLHNERVKQALRLRDRRHRDRDGLFLIEGYRELRRALEGGWMPTALFYCRSLFLGTNEDALIEQCRAAGADLLDCSAPVFQKLSYRDRPDGLLALAPQRHCRLDDLALPPQPLLLVMEQVEKPGNLGTMLRSADAGGDDPDLRGPAPTPAGACVARLERGSQFRWRLLPAALQLHTSALLQLPRAQAQRLHPRPHSDGCIHISPPGA